MPYDVLPSDTVFSVDSYFKKSETNDMDVVYSLKSYTRSD